MKYFLLSLLTIGYFSSIGQELKVRDRSSLALSGSEFAKNIRDDVLSLADRERIIFNEIKSGNIPDFYRKLPH